MKDTAHFIAISKNEFSPARRPYRRYFAGFGKRFRVVSAWCFAGSKFYSDEKRALVAAAILQEKGWTTRITTIKDHFVQLSEK